MDLSEIPTGSGFKRHPWEEVRAEFFTDALGSLVAAEAECSLLDAGSGDGWLAAHFVERYSRLHVTCFDPGYEEAGVPTEQDRLRFTPSFPDETFDVATLLDVVEHVEDDLAFLDNVRTHLRPGGGLLVSVPAWPQLFSSHDVALRHYRRYTPGALREVLTQAGFEVLSGNGLFHSLLPPRWLSTARERSRRDGAPQAAAGDHSLAWHGPEPLRKVTGSVLRTDTRVTGLAERCGIALPGLSVWAICRRPA